MPGLIPHPNPQDVTPPSTYLGSSLTLSCTRQTNGPPLSPLHLVPPVPLAQIPSALSTNRNVVKNHPWIKNMANIPHILFLSRTQSVWLKYIHWKSLLSPNSGKCVSLIKSVI